MRFHFLWLTISTFKLEQNINQWSTIHKLKITLTKTFVNRLSSSFGSGIGCLAFGLIVLCLMLACRPCNFDEGITLSVSCPAVFSFDIAIPIVTKFQISTYFKENHTYAPISSYHIERATGFFTLQTKTIPHRKPSLRTKYAPTSYSYLAKLLLEKSLWAKCKLKEFLKRMRSVWKW